MPPQAPWGAPRVGGDQDSAPRWEVADLLRLSGDAYRARHPVPPSHHQGMHDLVVCRTAQLGGHVERCPHGACARYAYPSCRHRHWPPCQTCTKGQWVEDRKAEVLPVPSCHLVCTVPHDLNPLILTHKRPLCTLLCNAASQTLVQFGHRNRGGQVGGTMVLHTWDQTLGAHCHVHCVIAAGALASAGQHWNNAHPRFLFPVRALRTVVRGKCLEALHQASASRALTYAADTAALGTPEGLARLTDQLYSTAWVVYAKPPFAGPEQILDSVGRYTPRVAMANHRSVKIANGGVSFTSRNRRPGDRVQTMTLEAHAFLRRFLLHVLPHGCRRIRHIGFLAHRCKAHALRQCRQLLGQVPDPPQRGKPTVVEWRQQVTGIDITPCPQCGHGPLVRHPLPRPVLRQGEPSPPPVCDSS